MKKCILIIFVLMFFGSIEKTHARGIIFYHNGPKIETKIKLPENAVIDNSHVNIGVIYEQFGIFWMPVWNYGEPKYVFINDDETTYYDIEEAEIYEIEQSFNVDLSKSPSPSLWNKIGLKPIVLLIIIFGIWSDFFKPGKKNDNQELEQGNDQN